MELQWVTAIASASPSCFVGIVRAELSNIRNESDRFALSLGSSFLADLFLVIIGFVVVTGITAP